MLNCPKDAFLTTLLIVLIQVAAVHSSEWCKNTFENRSTFCLSKCNNHSCVRKFTSDLNYCYFKCARIKKILDMWKFKTTQKCCGNTRLSAHVPIAFFSFFQTSTVCFQILKWRILNQYIKYDKMINIVCLHFNTSLG